MHCALFRTHLSPFSNVRSANQSYHGKWDHRQRQKYRSRTSPSIRINATGFRCEGKNVQFTITKLHDIVVSAAEPSVKIWSTGAVISFDWPFNMLRVGSCNSTVLGKSCIAERGALVHAVTTPTIFSGRSNLCKSSVQLPCMLDMCSERHWELSGLRPFSDWVMKAVGLMHQRSRLDQCENPETAPAVSDMDPQHRDLARSSGERSWMHSHVPSKRSLFFLKTTSCHLQHVAYIRFSIWFVWELRILIRVWHRDTTCWRGIFTINGSPLKSWFHMPQSAL